jgi:uncharacterized coiled-coil DUF342 family protein
MMKEDFAEQLKAQSDVWTSQIKDYRERFQQLGDKAREDYKKAMADMEAKAEEARQMAERIRTANEAAWKDMFSASQKAFAEMQKGWAEAIGRFR